NTARVFLQQHDNGLRGFTVPTPPYNHLFVIYGGPGHEGEYVITFLNKNPTVGQMENDPRCAYLKRKLVRITEKDSPLDDHGKVTPLYEVLDRGTRVEMVGLDAPVWLATNLRQLGYSVEVME